MTHSYPSMMAPLAHSGHPTRWVPVPDDVDHRPSAARDGDILISNRDTAKE